MADNYQYVGEELSLFENATRWKRYLLKKIKPFIKGNVLEVGAGIGSTTKMFNDNSTKSWTMLEPDDTMHQMLVHSQSAFPKNSVIIYGSITALTEQKFDTIMYIDVLEHIENDRKELIKASEHLNINGYLIVLSPAFNFMYSEFDKSTGHYRRYKKNTLKNIAPDNFQMVKMMYLDSFGFFASVMNKIFLHQSYPTKKQVQFWDKNLITISKITDKLFFHSFGKSILAVWQKK